MLILLVPGLWNDKVAVCSDIMFAGGETIFTGTASGFLFLVDNRFCVLFDA